MTFSNHRVTSRPGRNDRHSYFDSFDLWQFAVRKHSSFSLFRHETLIAGEPLDRERLIEESAYQGTLALALEFPFRAMPVCREPNSETARHAIRRYIDNLLDEARLVGNLVQDRRAVSHLYLLGNVTSWLDEAELTEIMYRLGRCFHLRQDARACAVLEIEDWNLDKGLYALIRGLGFSHLLITGGSRPTGVAETEHFSAIRHCWDELGLKAVTPVFDAQGIDSFQRIEGKEALQPGCGNEAATIVSASPGRLVGLGLGAWSVLQNQLIQNATQLNHYYGSLSERRLEGRQAGFTCRKNAFQALEGL